MPSTLPSRRVARLATALTLAALATLAACNDTTGPDDEGEDHADDVWSIRLTVAQGAASQAFTYTVGAAAQPALRLPVGTSTVTATFLDETGAVVALDPAGELELAIRQIAPANAFTFARTGNFAGTVAAPAAGAATTTVCLNHPEEDHCEIEFPNVVVTIGS